MSAFQGSENHLMRRLIHTHSDARNEYALLTDSMDPPSILGYNIAMMRIFNRMGYAPWEYFNVRWDEARKQRFLKDCSNSNI
jgi:hypothetical protein